MANVFDVLDKTGRRIRLTSERWSHIVQEHPEVVPYAEELIYVLQHPDTTRSFPARGVHYFSRSYKERTAKHLLVIIKYLNAHGFIVTAYFVRSLP